MRFGIAVPHYGAEISPARLLIWSKLVEELGFDIATVTDHLAQTADVCRSYPENFYESFAVLTYLAATTTTIDLGTSVTVLPLRHPLHTARALATIDQISGGRLIVGIGIGGAPLEYQALGLDYRRRAAITDEYLAVITGLWRGEITSYQGEFTAFDNVLATPVPHQTGGPRLWVGGSSPAALRRAILHQAHWHPVFPTLDSLDTASHTAQEIAATLHCTPPPIAPRIRICIHPKPINETSRALGVGSAEQIREDLRQLARRGITTIIFDPVAHPFLPGAPATRSAADELAELRTIEELADKIIDTADHRVRSG